MVAPTEQGRATRLKHRLEVVRAADHLLRADRQARWLTERQLRHAQICGRCVANRRAWRRRPDGVLISGTHETAIEVETTAKPFDQYLVILDAYADHGWRRTGTRCRRWRRSASYGPPRSWTCACW